jgi:amino acid transporter/mannitol/fructose-specific phosphotransferase system IIA component (Ntr-type)
MSKTVEKKLTFIDVFCVATGAMISSGLFILPGLAFGKAGPAAILSYALAAILCIPTALSKAELTTAMPKAGGDYFYVMRGFGPLFGSIAGISAWFSLSLKSAFALLGMGAYLSVFTHLPLVVVACLCCVFFIVINLLGVKEAAVFQVVLVLGLLTILLSYVFLGIKDVNPGNFTPFIRGDLNSILTTASFVFISYGGLTKIAALAEEIKNPGKNIPLGLMVSLAVICIIYTAVVYITVGVMNPDSLEVTLTPISDGASVVGGRVLEIVVSVAAFLAFISTANAGIMTASRYPLGMSRDKLLPDVLQKISSRFGTPYVAILFTGLFMLAVILLLKLELLVKVASSVLILLFMFANLTLILFRESEIRSYMPKFRAPLYPYLQIFGLLAGVFLLIEMGTFTIFLTLLFLSLGFIWYKVYAQKKASQHSALVYVLEKLVAKDKELAADSLLAELNDIIIQQDDFIRDRFHRLVEESKILDIEEPCTMESLFEQIADVLSSELDIDSKDLYEKFYAREMDVSTVVREGLAIPHIIVDAENAHKLVLVRAKSGIIFPENRVVHIAFVIVGSTGEPGRSLHLKDLVAIAQITNNPEFDKEWMSAKNEEELRTLLFLAERKRSSS